MTGAWGRSKVGEFHKMEVGCEILVIKHRQNS